MCTAIVSSRGIFPVDGSARGEDFYLATRGDFSLATRGDLEVATREDFFMAMDRGRGRRPDDPRRRWDSLPQRELRARRAGSPSDGNRLDEGPGDMNADEPEARPHVV